MAFPIDSPLPIFYDRNGDVLDAGYVYIGVANLNPITNPIPVYWSDSTPAPQPLRTIRGYIARNGAPSSVLVDSAYSLVVQDRNRQLVLSLPNATSYLQLLAGPTGSSLIGFLQAGTGAVATTAQAKMREAISVYDFMTATEVTQAQNGSATDLQTALAAAHTYAASVGRPLHYPAGIYPHSGVLTVDGFDLFGDGPQTELRATSVTSPSPQQAIFMTGNGPKVRNLKTSTTWSGGRQQNTNGHAIALLDCTNFEVSGVEVTGAATAGILGQYCRTGRVFNNKVSNTLADGIHFTNDSHDIAIFANETDQTGDDNIAVVSYQEPRPAEYGGGTWPQSSRFVIFGNQAKGSALKINNGVSIIGSADIIVDGQLSENIALACVSINAQTVVYNSYSPSNITVANCRAKDCALDDVRNHAQFYVYGQTGSTCSDIHFIDNSVVRTASGRLAADPFRVQMFSGATSIDDVTCDGLVVDNGNGTGKIAVLGSGAGSPFGDVTIRNTTANNFADGVYTVAAMSSGRISLVGGTYADVFTTPSLNRFVNLSTIGSITSLTINNHDVIGSNSLTAIYGGDASATTARPVITALRNTQNRLSIADVHGCTLNGSAYQIDLDFNNNFGRKKLAYGATAPLEVRLSATRHQAVEVNFKVVRNNDVDQWQFLRQRWINTSAAGVGTVNVDYIDVGGGRRIQRTDIENFSNGTVGAWTLALAGGIVTATFTPTVSSHIQIEVTSVYRSA